MAHADALVACNLVPASRQVALRVDGRSRDALLTCLWAALGRQTNEKRPPDAGRRWKVSSRQGPFQAPVTQLSGHAGSDVVGQLEMAPRSPGSPVPSLLSDVNLGAGFFDGALWAHFDSRRVAERYRRHERFRRKVRRSAARRLRRTGGERRFVLRSPLAVVRGGDETRWCPSRSTPMAPVVPVSLKVSMAAEGFHGNRGLVP
jgi:hypothetical protein